MNYFKERIIPHLPDMIMIYAFVCMVYQMLVIIYPVKVFFAQFHLDMLSKALCILGLFLILADIMGDRIIFNGINMKWLILMILSAIISTLVRAHYGLADNIKIILWSIVQMLLIYTLPLRISEERQKRLLIYIHSVGCIIYIPVLIYMFYQFVELKCYVNADGKIQGWFEGRLFGVMDTLYKGTSIVAVLLLGSAFLFTLSKNIIKKGAYLFTMIVFFIYIALSDTRSIYVGFSTALFVIIFFYDYWKRILFFDNIPVLRKHIKGHRRRLLSVFMYVITITILAMGIRTIRNRGMEFAYNYVISTYGEDALEKRIGEDLKIESAGDLDRPKQATITSRRVYIWKCYAKIIMDKPLNLLIGLSPGGYNKYIIEHYPESYIVKDFWLYYPEERIKYNVYWTHNGYLHVLVTTGLSGIVSISAFLIGFILLFINRSLAEKNTMYDLVLSAIVIMMLTFILFEGDIFFCTTVMSFAFWLLTGMLMK